jgi:hypothetical protein
MSKNHQRSVSVAVTAAAAVLTSIGATSAISPATAVEAAEDPAQSTHCYIVLEPLQPGAAVSQVRSRECVQPGEKRTTQRGLLLMTWYEHANFNPNGGRSTSLEGSAGPCDSDGYGFRDTGGWRRLISSYKLFNQCDWFRGWTGTNYGGTSPGWFYGTQNGYVGPTLNDNTGSIQITS